MTARIKAYRSSASVFGAAESYVQNGGIIVTFPTLAEAEAEAQIYNKLSGPNVSYRAVLEDE